MKKSSRPKKGTASASRKGALPFVLDRPSTAEEVPFDEKKLEELDAAEFSALETLLGKAAALRARKTSRYKTCRIYTGHQGYQCDAWWWDDGDDIVYDRNAAIAE